MKVKMDIQAVAEIEVPEQVVVAALENDDDDSVFWIMDELEQALKNKTVKITLDHVGRAWAFNEFNEELFSDLDYTF